REAEEERRRAGDAGGLGVGEVLADLGAVGVGVHALLEGAGLHAGLLRVARQVVGAERLLVGEELLVHLPVLALVARALGGGGGGRRREQRLDLLQVALDGADAGLERLDLLPQRLQLVAALRRDGDRRDQRHREQSHHRETNHHARHLPRRSNVLGYTLATTL